MPQRMDRAGTGPGGGAADIDRQTFRDAMSRLGAAVHVITTAGPAGICGYTGSAVTSVSDDPPTVLVCLNRASQMNAVFKENGVFCINTLTARQEDLSAMFAGRGGIAMAERFRRERWQSLATGAPALTTGLLSVDCRISSITEVGTHSVIFGTVASVHFGRDEPALMYFNRAYRALEGTDEGRA